MTKAFVIIKPAFRDGLGINRPEMILTMPIKGIVDHISDVQFMETEALATNGKQAPFMFNELSQAVDLLKKAFPYGNYSLLRHYDHVQILTNESAGKYDSQYMLRPFANIVVREF